MRQQVRRAVVISAVVGTASILFGVGSLVQAIESNRLGATGERVAGVIAIIGGLIFVGTGVWAVIYGRRNDNDSPES